jgi:hypothetical protein
MVSPYESMHGIVPSCSNVVRFEGVCRRCQCLIEPRFSRSLSSGGCEPEWRGACPGSLGLASAEEPSAMFALATLFKRIYGQSSSSMWLSMARSFPKHVPVA